MSIKPSYYILTTNKKDFDFDYYGNLFKEILELKDYDDNLDFLYQKYYKYTTYDDNYEITCSLAIKCDPESISQMTITPVNILMDGQFDIMPDSDLPGFSDGNVKYGIVFKCDSDNPVGINLHDLQFISSVAKTFFKTSPYLKSFQVYQNNGIETLVIIVDQDEQSELLTDNVAIKDINIILSNKTKDNKWKPMSRSKLFNILTFIVHNRFNLENNIFK